MTNDFIVFELLCRNFELERPSYVLAQFLSRKEYKSGSKHMEDPV